MSSILKVDTIQDQSGNNIINENADTITIGASGDVIAVPAGTALLPAITTTGDANTGIFFPAADTIGFAEGGAEAMRIDSSGRVGIGTTSPSANLEVRGSSSNGQIYLGGSTTATYGKIYSDNDGTLIASADAGNNAASSYFGVEVDGTERMRINSSGNVGIGTAGPNTKLTVSGANSDTYGQLNVNATGAGADAQISFSTPLNGRGMYVDDSATNAFKIYSGAGKGGAGEFVIDNSGNVTINGSLSKSSGSFRIPHPIKPETHELVHSFVEAPQADNIYRGKVELVDGRAEVNIDTVASMTEGTFVALNREVQCFTSNESDWDAVRGSILGNILTIECQNAESTATISWLVIGERQDQHMYDTDWTDENGKVIVEPLKEERITTLENN
jgi:hypothetical protein